MKRCPVCNKEYDDEEDICDGCGEKLEDCSFQQITECILVHCESQIQSRIYQQTLQNNNIPFYISSGQFGGLSSLYMGYSVFGEDIIVSSEDYEKAYELIYNKELLDDTNTNLEFEVEIEDNDDSNVYQDEEETTTYNGRRRVCKIAIWTIIIINAIVLLWLISNGLVWYLLHKIFL